MMRDEWGELLITGWNEAGWMDQPSRVGDRIGRLIGAPAGSVVMGDTLSIKSTRRCLLRSISILIEKLYCLTPATFPPISTLRMG
jgi:kynureninase